MSPRVQRWSRALVLRIPILLAKICGLAEGTRAQIAFHHGRLVIRSLRRRKYTLDELLAPVSYKNLHGETDTGTSVGREVR